MHPTGSAAPGLPPKKFRSSQHCKGGAGGAWDVENRQLKSISGASMRDPNFWKGQSRRQFTWGSWRFGIAFSDPALGNVAPALGNVVPALGNWKFWFFIFRSPDLSRSISDMTLTPFTIKIHPPPLLGSISRKRFATWKSGRFISARPLTCETNRTDRIFAFSSFGTLKFGSSTLKSIFSTLKFVFSTFKFVSSSLKFVFDAFQHSEMDAGCVPALWNEGAMNSKIIHCTLNAFFRVLGIWMGCMQLIPTLAPIILYRKN